MGMALRFNTIVGDIWRERKRQVDKWGSQHHKQSTGQYVYWQAESYNQKVVNDLLTQGYHTYGDNGPISWEEILMEEIYEAMAERDWNKRRTELIQCAAVILAAIEDGDASNVPG